MKPRRQIEREFGVPFAGEILDPIHWTQTALKQLPPGGPLDCLAIFGRRAPLIVDLGCGNGRFLLQSAVWRPDFDHLGVDPLPLVLRYATRRANQRGLTNLRFAAIDGQQFVEKYLAPGTIHEIHCYHPQPYYDPREAHRRLLTPHFLALVHGALEPGGKFFVQTDNPGYWRYVELLAPVFFDMQVQRKPWPDAPKGRTRQEIIALKRGLPVFRGWGLKREGLGASDALRLAEQLPPPLFDADRRLQELDREEGG